MHARFITSIGLLTLAVLLCGCTTQDPPAAPVVTPTLDPILTTVIPTTTLAPSITNGRWKLGWYDDTKGVWSSVISGSTITAIFGDDEKVAGSGGCNQYTTDYHLGDSPRLWIRRPVVSAMLCATPTGVMHQESAYFTDIERAQNYTITKGQLLVFDQANRRILQFDPV